MHPTGAANWPIDLWGRSVCAVRRMIYLHVRGSEHLQARDGRRSVRRRVPPAPANVVVQSVGCRLGDHEGGRDQTVGSGDARLFPEAKVVKGSWQRDDRSQPTRFTDVFGQMIRLSPGPTWVEFLPVGTAVPASRLRRQRRRSRDSHVVR
jgi:hypothetical protein